jgi:hypothetical protein
MTGTRVHNRDGYWTPEFVTATDPAVIARMLNERWETIFALTQRVAALEAWERAARDEDHAA